MRRRITIEHDDQGNLWRLGYDRETTGGEARARDLETALRKAAVKTGLVEAQEDLQIHSVFEAVQVLEHILGVKQDDAPGGTGDMGWAHG